MKTIEFEVYVLVEADGALIEKYTDLKHAESSQRLIRRETRIITVPVTHTFPVSKKALERSKSL